VNICKVNTSQIDRRSRILFRIFLILIFLEVYSFCAEETSSSLTKQRIEVMELKKELNNFYNEKETEYKQRKKELESILAQIEKEKRDIQRLYNSNLDVLKDIKQEVETKTGKIYNSMKPKDAAEIFNQMIGEGKIDDVFAIIMKLKENNVTQIMKFLSVSNASLITEKFQNYSNENKEK
jgi:flagellar motility protein MotE (MotC chaperone)